FSVGGIPVDPCINGDTVAFYGAGSGGQQGIYRATSVGSPIKVADLNTAIPSGTGNFTGFSISGIPTDPCVSGDTVAFVGMGAGGQQGVYRKALPDLAPIKVADTGTAIPGGTGSFTSFSALSLDPTDASNVAVVGSGAVVKGVYASIGNGALARIVDTTMAIPGSTSTFADFGSVSIDPSDVAFLAFGSAGEKGIYADIGGTLVDVVNVEDTIGGKLIADLDFGPQGFTETAGAPSLTYRATFSDGSSGIFAAAVPRPIPGDFNGNGVVDAADYVVWRKGLETIYTQADYDVWRVHFGQTAGSGAGAMTNAAVPEPTTLVLLLFAATAGCFRRGRAV
ncbi:MAG TPA: PEP-CTERM sorting domain-containing protein, partial [Planctomycetaceae bacterium]